MKEFNTITKLKYYFNGLKIRNKILLLYFILILCSIGISVSVYIQMTNRYIERTIYQMSLSEMTTNDKSVEFLLEEVNNFSKQIISDIMIQAELDTNSETPVKYDIQRILEASTIFNKTVSSIYVFDYKGNNYYYESDNFKNINLQQIRSMSWYQDILSKKGGFILNVNGGGLIHEHDNDYLSFIRIINSNKDHQPIGIMLINVKADTLMNVLNLENSEHVQFVFQETAYNTSLKLRENHIFDYTDYMDRLNHTDLFHEEQNIHGKSYNVTGLSNDTYQYKLIKVVPDYDRSDMLSNFNTVIFSIIIINALLIIYGSFFVSRYITNPIVELTNSMKDVEEGKLVPVQVAENHDEIGSLKAGYNYMITRIKELINKVIEEQKTIKNAELRVIMEQIKPHFIYNTLDSISALIMLNRTEEAYDSLTALAKFYRSSLSDGRMVVSIAVELEIIKNYLFIQNIRFNNLFSVEYRMDDQILCYQVPKLILQPLVENSLYHGIRPMGMDGLIRIEGTIEGAFVKLIVEDNGRGMSEDLVDKYNGLALKLERQETYEPSNEQSSVGIPATIKRIYHMFGTSSQFMLTSSHSGTKITILLPREVNYG